MPVSARLGRAIAAGVLAVTAVAGVSGCQFQSLQNYTPADGVNVTVKDVAVRNLVIVATGDGQGVLLGTIVSGSTDQLTSVRGSALLPNGDKGSPLQVTTTAAVPVSPAQPVLLIDQAIKISSSDLRAGLTAQVELTFAKAGSVSVTAPVVDKNSPEYKNLYLPA